MSLFGLVTRGLRRLRSLAGADGFALPVSRLKDVSQLSVPFQIVSFQESVKQLRDTCLACRAGLSHNLTRLHGESVRSPIRVIAGRQFQRVGDASIGADCVTDNSGDFVAVVLVASIEVSKSYHRSIGDRLFRNLAGLAHRISLAYLSTTEVYP